jgi:hypothetical protein
MKRLKKWRVWYYFTDDWKVYPMEIPEGQLITGKGGQSELNEIIAGSDIGSPDSSANPLLFQSLYIW